MRVVKDRNMQSTMMDSSLARLIIVQVVGCQNNVCSLKTSSVERKDRPVAWPACFNLRGSSPMLEKVSLISLEQCQM